MKKLYTAISLQGANQSRAREAIYSLLLDANDVLSVSELSSLLVDTYPKKISQNTLYRHLNFFIDNNLVIVLQDNHKRAYYYLSSDECLYFSLCTVCNAIHKVDIDKSKDTSFLEAQYITLHKKCNICKSK